MKALQASIQDTLSKVFGHKTPEYDRYIDAAYLDDGWMSTLNEPSPGEIIEFHRSGREKSLALFNQAIKSLEEDLAHATEHSPIIRDSAPRQPAESDEVFIVHGRDSPAKVEVARLVERAGLKAVILHEQANQGRTIIEKFEAHGGAAGFAVIVATPDDVGGLDADHLQPRARQNVVGEMFWFAGRLGRNRVCALIKGKIELPSDFAGVGYTEMDDRGAWKQELLRELQAAGYKDLDWGKALS